MRIDFLRVVSQNIFFSPLSGLVPLHNACSYGHYELTELLVSAGAGVNAADLWRFTPLHEAAAKGKADIVRLLLKVRDPAAGTSTSHEGQARVYCALCFIEP